MSLIDNLPDDRNEMYAAIQGKSDEELQQIKNECTDPLIVYSGSLSDYDTLRGFLPEKNVDVLQAVDFLIEERNKAQKAQEQESGTLGM